MIFDVLMTFWIFQGKVATVYR